MNTNKLKINMDKTKYMILSSVRSNVNKDTILKGMSDTVIECVENIKYLGVIIDSRLVYFDS